jgi:hypothetical protein
MTAFRAMGQNRIQERLRMSEREFPQNESAGSQKNGNEAQVSRRGLIKRALGAGAAAAAASAGGCSGTGNAGVQRADGNAQAGPNAHNQTGSAGAIVGVHGSRVATAKRLEAEVVVVGGGMAGVCAAIAAARNGASVVLVHDRAVLGGNSSSEIRVHVCGADHHGSRCKGDPLVTGLWNDSRESGILEELRLTDAARNPQRSASLWDLLLYETVRAEPRITLLLETHCCGVEMAGPDRIAAVLASRHGTEDLLTISGQVFIDCSGDGRLGAESGAEYRVGREARAEYGESLAPVVADRSTMGSSLMFITKEHDRPMPFTPPAWIHRFPTCKDLPHRSHGDWSWGFWWVEWGGELDTIKDRERVREELLAAALGVWDHIKNGGQHPKSANWAIEWVGFVPGNRESRRFVGDHVLTQAEVQRGEPFDDGVGHGGWPIDLHVPAGIYSKQPPYTSNNVPLYNLPFRCLYSRNVSNLLFAGRIISVSHAAFGSTRVMATGAVAGQAVGTAAALCVQRKLSPRQLGKEAIGDLQQRLLRDDAYIIGASNHDAADLARTAEVRASSEIAAARAANVINGVGRGVEKVSNRWVSDPAAKLPQWIELRFRRPERLHEVQVTFDSGLHRTLTLTLSSAFQRMIWGPQPEVARDYELLALDGESQTSLAKVEGNVQRRRVHRFEQPVTASGLRLTVMATNGAPTARVIEVRAY